MQILISSTCFLDTLMWRAAGCWLLAIGSRSMDRSAVRRLLCKEVSLTRSVSVRAYVPAEVPMKSGCAKLSLLLMLQLLLLIVSFMSQ